MNKNTPLNTGFQANLGLEVAIVGAGVSGLYTAYRFTESQALPAHQVQIFDMGEKIGGRLESVVMPEMNVVGELGGMRYLTSQKIVTTLIEDIFKSEMNAIDFPMGEASQLFMYLRKERFKQDHHEYLTNLMQL